jgi:hypothetical protein
VVHCSLSLHQSQDQEIGSCLIGGVDAACLASTSALSFPGMLVWPGTQYMVIAVSLAWRDRFFHRIQICSTHLHISGSTETMDISIGFGLAALIYISLDIFRELYIDFVDIRGKIRVFT